MVSFKYDSRLIGPCTVDRAMLKSLQTRFRCWVELFQRLRSDFALRGPGVCFRVMKQRVQRQWLMEAVVKVTNYNRPPTTPVSPD